MNDSVLQALTFIAAISSGLVGGTFFAFSNFIMKALARLPASNGISAMQSINIAALLAAVSFLLAFAVRWNA